MAEIPERFGRTNCDTGTDPFQNSATSLLEARIRELEQQLQETRPEIGEDGTNWFPESFVIQLQDQLREVTERCEHFCKMAMVPDGTESRKQIASLSDELTAANSRIRELEQERAELLAAWKNQINALREQYTEEVDKGIAKGAEHFYQVSGLQAQLRAVTQEREMAVTLALAELAQLQARNRALVDLLREMREHAEYSSPQGRNVFRRVDAALIQAELPETEKSVKS
jgi:uncharacterized protein YydD (DUF2326 family)